MSNSEKEDDPCSSGEDWNEEEKKKSTRRQSSRLSKKPRLVITDSFSSDDDEDYEVEKEKPKNKRNGGYKKQKIKPVYSSVKKDQPEVQSSDEKPTTYRTIPVANGPAFSNGTFVILKEDAEAFDPNSPTYIWRVDGKALLQKFEPFTENGDLKYKSTSVYTGWSCMESDKYAPVKDIQIISNVQNKLVLTFDWSQLKLIVIDSD